MIVKNNSDLENLKHGGAITKDVIQQAISLIKPGVATIEIDNSVSKMIKDAGGAPSFLGVNAGEGPYPYSCCVSINHQLVHTLPSESAVIKEGDVVTVDD